METKKIKLFDLQIDDIDLRKFIFVIENAIKNKIRISICYTNAHVARLAEKNVNLRKIINSFDVNYADGYGLSLASKILNGYSIKKFTLTQYAFDVLKVCEKNNWKIFLLGGEQEILNQAVEKIKHDYPDLILAGFLNGFSQLDGNTIDEINDSRADILWVGLGTPKQEYWVRENFALLNCMVINCVGDLYSILAGIRSRGPEFLSDNGLEWMFRFIQHPIKFFDRYTIGIPAFIFLVIKTFFRNKR